MNKFRCKVCLSTAPTDEAMRWLFAGETSSIMASLIPLPIPNLPWPRLLYDMTALKFDEPSSMLSF
jgi:hypothetical protein